MGKENRAFATLILAAGKGTKPEQWQAQIQALTQELATQRQHNAIQDQAIAASKAADVAINKRISDLADYDQRAEISILFDVNSAALSDKAKADLKELAAKAKAYRGYLIQVVGYADAVGSFSRNQALIGRNIGIHGLASQITQKESVIDIAPYLPARMLEHQHA